VLNMGRERPDVLLRRVAAEAEKLRRKAERIRAGAERRDLMERAERAESVVRMATLAGLGSGSNRKLH
jgi:tRNA G37 N-methylase TrmD